MAAWRSSVVRVFSGNPEQGITLATEFLGSAFLVEPRRLITCKHVVEAASSSELYVFGPAWTSWQRVSRVDCDQERDLALLEVPSDIDLLATPMKLWHATLEQYSSARITPAGYSSATGPLETPNMSLRAYDGIRDVWMLHTHLNKGFSGGPAVMDTYVAGVVYAREGDGSKTYIIPASAVRSFLASRLNESAELMHEKQTHNAGIIIQADPPPRYIIGRDDVLVDLLSRLNRLDKAASRQQRAICIKGLGGIGKTTIARAMCWDPRTAALFPDGVFWVTLGEAPQILANLHTLLAPFVRSTSDYPTIQLATNLLRATFAEKRALIIVDDVWAFEDLRHFLHTGPRVDILFTTRDASIAHPIDAEVVQLDVLSPDAAREYLRLRVGSERSDSLSDAQLDQLVGLVGALPLALTIVAIHLREGMTINVLLEELSAEMGRLNALELYSVTAASDGQHLSLDAALTLSFRRLDRKYLSPLLLLGIVRSKAEITPAIMAALSGYSAFQAQQLLALFTAKSFLTLGTDSITGNLAVYNMHDLVRAKCRAILFGADESFENQPRFSSTADAGRFIISRIVSYRQDASWSSLGADPYIGRNLFHHLSEARDTALMFSVLEEEVVQAGELGVANGWLLTHERSGWPNQFLADCETAWRLAEESAREELHSIQHLGRLSLKTLNALGRVARVACLISSVVGRGAGITPPLGHRLVEHGVWTAMQALYAMGRALAPRDLIDFVIELPEPAREMGLSLALTRLGQDVRRLADPEKAITTIVGAMFLSSGAQRQSAISLLKQLPGFEGVGGRSLRPIEIDFLPELLHELNTGPSGRYRLFDAAIAALEELVDRPAVYEARVSRFWRRRNETTATVRDLRELLVHLSQVLELYLWRHRRVHSRYQRIIEKLRQRGVIIAKEVLELCRGGHAALASILEPNNAERAFDYVVGRIEVAREVDLVNVRIDAEYERAKIAKAEQSRLSRAAILLAPHCSDERLNRICETILLRKSASWEQDLEVLFCILNDLQRASIAASFEKRRWYPEELPLVFALAASAGATARTEIFQQAFSRLQALDVREHGEVALKLVSRHLPLCGPAGVASFAAIIKDLRYSRAAAASLAPGFSQLSTNDQEYWLRRAKEVDDPFGQFVLGGIWSALRGELEDTVRVQALVQFARLIWPKPENIRAVLSVLDAVPVPQVAATAFLDIAAESARGLQDHEPVFQSLARLLAYGSEPSLLCQPPILHGTRGIVLSESQRRAAVHVKLRSCGTGAVAEPPFATEPHLRQSLVRYNESQPRRLADTELGRRLIESLAEAVEINSRAQLFEQVADASEEFALRGYRLLSREAAFAVHDCYRWWP